MDSDNYELLVQDFQEILGLVWRPPSDLSRAARAVVKGCGASPEGKLTRKRRLLTIVNQKFRLNYEQFQDFLDALARRRVFLNYHQKLEVRAYFDERNTEQLQGWLERRGLTSSDFERIEPVSSEETLHQLRTQLSAPVIARSDARTSDPSERRQEILRSLFGSFVFSVFPSESMHRFFNTDCRSSYYSDFHQHLAQFYPSVLHRDCALAFILVDDEMRSHFNYPNLRDSLCALIRELYGRLSNHCYLAVLIEPFRDGEEDGQWRLFSDLILYAEKHREVTLKIGYFRPDKISRATLSHIPTLDPKLAKFDVANEGFFFRDCFVLAPDQTELPIRDSDLSSSLLLMFEKNERDETVLPCPACRSINVAGNSYPVLGVRSWECQNPICPERSAFDRGNRYSLSQLLKQEAIESEHDQIPESSLRRWKLDVVPGITNDDVLEMLLRHFTLNGDTALLVNAAGLLPPKLGRHIRYEPISREKPLPIFAEFQASALFKRFVIDRPMPTSPCSKRIKTDLPNVEMIQGDCFEVLSNIADESIDAAATSPPYYNAKSYSVWPNIYCYLYDMYNSALQVYRVLKPGATYLFNIFDYFDNENIVVLSGMGKKRMILGAYIINVFRRVGFELIGNTVWCKGEIEGKRNFNQGNRSPYYQFPFNCWEHVLAFRKPGRDSGQRFPQILAVKPVMKMVRGENRLGHSAPFPSAIPQMLVKQMEPGQTVLDPYAGSMTTGRAAFRQGIRSISIELHMEYCEIGLRLLRKDADESSLFPIIVE